MDNKQAAAMLRTHAAYPGFNYLRQEMERGADALGMLEWLFVPGRFGLLHSGFMKPSAEETTFLAYCEAKFEEYRKGLTK